MKTYEAEMEYKGETGMGVFAYETEEFYDADIGGRDGIGVTGVTLKHIRMDDGLSIARPAVELDYGAMQLDTFEDMVIGSEIQVAIDDGEIS